MIPAISAREWNDHVRYLRTRFPVKVQARDPFPPEHSWMVTPFFDKDRKRWSCNIRPGSVNGKIATVKTVISRLPEDAIKYLTKAGIIKGEDRTKAEAVPLDFDPPLDLPWREIGGNADPLSVSESGGSIRTSFEPVPAYFKKLGVPDAGSQADPGPNSRRLFASDLVLNQPRTYLTNDVSVAPGGVLGGSIVSVNPGSVTPKEVNQPPSVSAYSRFTVPAVTLTFADIFFQRFQDDPSDQLHLSTVYALSPPLGTGEFPTYVDEKFDVMTRYYCHYNLAHGTRTTPRVEIQPQTLYTGLAAGLGDVMFNYILANHNDFAQATLDLYQQNSLRGAFWVV